MTVLNINLGYTRREIFQPFHDRIQRWACNICHRRAGKTVAAMMDVIDRALGCKLPRPRYHYIAPLRNQAKTVAWDYLKEFTRPIQARPPNEAELRVDLLNDARITLFGADNPDALRGPYSDGVVIDEYGDVAPSVWKQIVRPMLADRGGFAIIMGTIKGRDKLWQLYCEAKNDPAWYTCLLRASDTGVLSTDELADARRLMTPEAYAAEFECDPYAAILGSYYAKEVREAELSGRVVDDLPVLAHQPMHTAWDLGNGANMAVWAFQVGDAGPLVHDFIQIPGFYLLDYIAEVKKRGYEGFDYLPKDACVHAMETGRTRIETFIAEKRKPVKIMPHSREDRINAAKLTLRVAKFNTTKCEAGLEALRNYRQEWNERLDVFRDNPEHDWASHGADGFGHLAMAWKMIRKEVPPEKPRLFIPTQELTIADYIKFGNRANERRERV